MFEEAKLGKRIKELRIKKGMTLKQLSERTGFTQGYLSKVETSKKAPPVSTLILIAKHLGTSLSEMFGNVEGKSSIILVKKNERQFVTHSASAFGYLYQTVAPQFHEKRMEPLILTVPKNTRRRAFFQHEGQEFIFVLEGTLKFFHGNQEFIVEEGDCLYFDASVPHTGVRHGKEEVKCLIVIYTPEK